MDLIKCPICGEEYSPSYPTCPFCEEDNETGGTGRRTRHITSRQSAQSARGALIAVLVLVLALLGWYLFGGRQPEPNAQTEQEATDAQEPVSDAPENEPNADDPGTDDPSNGQEDQTVPPETDPVQNVDVSNAALSRADFTLNGVGDQYTIKLSGTEAQPLWSVDNPNVASISTNGTVTAVANGDTTVRCKVGDRELSCTVRVRGTGKTAAAGTPMTALPVESVAPEQPNAAQQTNAAQQPAAQEPAHVDASALKVKTGAGVTLQKDHDTGQPDCTLKLGDSTTLTIIGTDVPVSGWTSDNTAVATINAAGVLKAAGKGTAHVTASIGDATLTCIVRVK